MEAESINLQEISFRKNIPTWKSYLINAVVTKFGQDVEVRTYSLDDQLKKFVNSLVFTVLRCKDPIVTQSCVIDVTKKEFYNNGDTEKVETDIQMGKNATIANGTKYNFHVEEGVCFDHKPDLGAQIVSISMTGCDMKVGDDVTKMDQTYNKELKFQCDHKEKLIIPPMTKVMAEITTSTKKFEQNYTLHFRSKKSARIVIRYLTKRQQRCGCFYYLGCCTYSVGYVYAGEILQALPDFDDDTEDNYCYFTLDGTLTWIGEECSVKIMSSEI